MNVLDIYPSFSWWICGMTAEEVDTVRELLDRNPSLAEAQQKAYYLVGDAAAFDLIPNTFDEIVVRYEPTPLKRLILERHTRDWLRDERGILRFQSSDAEYVNTETQTEARLSVFPVLAWQHR